MMVGLLWCGVQTALVNEKEEKMQVEEEEKKQAEAEQEEEEEEEEEEDEEEQEDRRERNHSEYDGTRFEEEMTRRRKYFIISNCTGLMLLEEQNKNRINGAQAA